MSLLSVITSRSIAAVDVYYLKDIAKSVCVLFDTWSSRSATDTLVIEVPAVSPYEPGAFYKRELPCILKVLEQVDLSQVEALVVDGYVYLDDKSKPGLGAHLYNALNQKIPVVGVAKSYFFDSEVLVKKIFRGESKRPLYVTAVGMDLEVAAEYIYTMPGSHQKPEILKYLDQITRQ